jgi:DNA-binding transcriptional regulator YhcF (GntR family)
MPSIAIDQPSHLRLGCTWTARKVHFADSGQTTFMQRRGWTELYRWQVDRAGSMPIFRQIYAQIRSAILSRTFPPGTKLPSTRELAQRLSVARESVVTAYEQLLAEGFISGKAGSGTYIASDLPEAIQRGPVPAAKRPIADARPVAMPRRDVIEFIDTTTESDDRPFNTAPRPCSGAVGHGHPPPVEATRETSTRRVRPRGTGCASLMAHLPGDRCRATC